MCPRNYKGCTDARKLLAHYRRCRDIRSRQASNQMKTQQHACLVCSLVARNAKGSIDRSRSTSPKRGTSVHLIPSLKLSSDQITFQQHSTQHVRSRSHSLGSTSTNLTNNGIQRIPRKMPPPPPRFSSSSQEEKVNSNGEFLSERSSFQKAMYCALNTTPSDNFALPADKKMVEKSLNYSDNYFRPRAESLEIRQTLSAEDKIFPGYSPVNNEVKDSDEFPVPPSRRRRSASCHVLSSSKSDPGFHTIQEEPVGEELQRILEGDK